MSTNTKGLTPHNSAAKGDIAETVLLPGDPLRAKYIAENFLENPRQINTVRHMFGYTGTYKGKEVTVMGSGMGVPSMGIYSYELIHFYGAKKLIRIGTSGAMQANVKVKDIVIGMTCSTDSNYLSQFELPGTYSPTCSYNLLEKAVDKCKELNVNYHVGNILCSDVFYNANKTVTEKWAKMGVLSVEMESTALYSNANYAGVEALTILTISDSLVTGEALSAEERQTSFTEMMEVALGII